MKFKIGDVAIFAKSSQRILFDHLGNVLHSNTICLITNITKEKSDDDLDPDDWNNYELFMPEVNVITSGWSERWLTKIDVQEILPESQKEK